MNWERVAEIKDELLLRCFDDPTFVDKLAFVIAQLEVGNNAPCRNDNNLFAEGMHEMQKQLSGSILQQLGFDS